MQYTIFLVSRVKKLLGARGKAALDAAERGVIEDAFFLSAMAEARAYRRAHMYDKIQSTAYGHALFEASRAAALLHKPDTPAAKIEAATLNAAMWAAAYEAGKKASYRALCREKRARRRFVRRTHGS